MKYFSKIAFFADPVLFHLWPIENSDLLSFKYLNFLLQLVSDWFLDFAQW